MLEGERIGYNREKIILQKKLKNLQLYLWVELLFGPNNFLLIDNSIIINDTYIINAIDEVLERNKA